MKDQNPKTTRRVVPGFGDVMAAELFKLRRTGWLFALVGALSGICLGFVMRWYLHAREMAATGVQERILPDVFLFSWHYYHANVVRVLLDLAPLLFVVTLLSQDRTSGLLQLLSSHGLHKGQYIAAQVCTYFLAVLFAWGVAGMLTLMAGEVCTYILWGHLTWHSQMITAVWRMIAGNTVQQFALVGFVLLALELSSGRPLAGVLGGLGYLYVIVPAESRLLSSVATLPDGNLAVAILNPTVPAGPFILITLGLLLPSLLITAAVAGVTFVQRKETT